MRAEALPGSLTSGQGFGIVLSTQEAQKMDSELFL